jgi:predicted HTH domain antitoxin
VALEVVERSGDRQNGDALVEFEIPQEIFEATGLSKEELLRLLAVILYDREHLSLGYASQLANLPKAEFVNLLAEEAVYFKYDEADLKEDMKNLKDVLKRNP